MIKLHIANIPFFPRTSKNTWAIGSGRSVDRRSLMEGITKDTAINRIHPRLAVAPTPTMMAIGAALAAPATSSEMWQAESSVYK